MQMIRGPLRIAGLPDVANDGAISDALASMQRRGADQMGEILPPAGAVAQQHRIAAESIPASRRHRPTRQGSDGGAGRGLDVDALMEAATGAGGTPPRN